MDKSAEPFEVPSGRPARGRVAAPPSKSHAIRALVCAALAEGTSTLHGLARCDADDVQRTITALRALGIAIDGERVIGAGGRIPNPNVTLDLGGSGTAFRFLAAVAALGPGRTTLTGDASLRRRPMRSIVDPLRTLGVHVECEAGELAPLVVSGGPPTRDEVSVDASSTSQALSALKLIGPALPRGLRVRTTGGAVSESYVQVTSETMVQFGAWITSENELMERAILDAQVLRVTGQEPPKLEVLRERIRREQGTYHPANMAIEGDWSGAAFLLAAAAVSLGDVTVGGLRWESAQADAIVVGVLSSFGAHVKADDGGARAAGRDRHPLDVDLRDAPDLAPLVGALGCVASGTTRVRGAAHLRIKESDRIAAVAAAARALGCEAHELPDGFEIDGPAKHGGLIETRHDHRIAMAFAVAGLAIPGVVIDDPACVAKSYPGFWEDLARLTAG